MLDFLTQVDVENVNDPDSDSDNSSHEEYMPSSAKKKSPQVKESG